MNKIFCRECGLEVPTTGEVFHPGGKVTPLIVGHCKRHPEAKRIRKNWVKEQFDLMRKVVDEATGIGMVFHSSGDGYWQREQSAAASGGVLCRISRVKGAL